VHVRAWKHVRRGRTLAGCVCCAPSYVLVRVRIRFDERAAPVKGSRRHLKYGPRALEDVLEIESLPLRLVGLFGDEMFS